MGPGTDDDRRPVEVTVFAAEWAAASAVEWPTASVAWVVASAAGCDVYVAWAGVEMFAVVDIAAGPVLVPVSVLAVQSGHEPK